MIINDMMSENNGRVKRNERGKGKGGMHTGCTGEGRWRAITKAVEERGRGRRRGERGGGREVRSCGEGLV